MAKPKLRRTLYIGLGGTGIKVIKEVKRNFLNNSAKSIPSMVKFLCVDSNKGDLDGQVTEGTEKLTTLEKLHVFVNEPDTVLVAGGSKYDWLPSSNKDSVVDIQDTGAGQVRSNGRFIFEENLSAFSERLDTLSDQLTSITSADDNYELLASANIDIHLVFSIAGGTGSGMFLSVASLIRQKFPSCNLMAYAFAPSFFASVGVNWNITHNAYGALLELDYHMHGGKGKYTNAEKGITRKIFDGVMYIDKNTYTNNHQEEAYSYDFDEVKVIVGHALYLSAGEIGTNSKSIVDNLRTAMSSGGFDKPCPNNGVKGAWVSSMGTSEIICNAKADVEFKQIKSAINILEDLEKGENSKLVVSETNRWIDTLRLNESQGDNDGNYFIDRILAPSAFATLKSKTKITVNDRGEYDDDSFNQINDDEINSKIENRKDIFAEKRTVIIDRIKEELFPTIGSGTIGLKKLIEVLSSLKSDMKESQVVLTSEISKLTEKIEEADDKIQSHALDIKSEMEKWPIRRDTNAIEDSKDGIRKYVADKYKYNKEILRRKIAVGIYNDLVELIDLYIIENSGILQKLRTNILSAIETLEKRAKGDFGGKHNTPSSTSIDLTSRADKLTTSHVDEHPVKDWNSFYSFINEPIETMSSKSNWDTTALDYFNSTQSVSENGPIIIRVMDTFTPEERVKKYRDLINRARPLMEISRFGEKITPSSFMFVSYPCNISQNMQEAASKLQEFKDEFKLALGSDKFEVIPQQDNNRILVYHQLGVIPPFYVQDISYKKNNKTYASSCEKLYLDYLTSAGVGRKVKPFTDVYFEKAYEENGHSLDGEYRGETKSIFSLWIDCFILGIIERKDNLYRIQYDNGELDYSVMPFKKWMNLGESRFEAFSVFENSSEHFIDFISSKIDQLLADADTALQRKQLFGPGDEKCNLYFEKTLMQFNSDEFKLAEVQGLFGREVSYLQNH